MNSSNLLGMDLEDLMAVAGSLGEKPFRGKQLFHQLYRRKEFDFDQMTDLSKSFRQQVQARFSIQLPQVHRRVESADGTVKFLLALEDGERIETVYIPDGERTTLCISSQVGCAVGCTFCLTAQMGFRRNLRPAEIVGQVLTVMAAGLLGDTAFNVVFMGMGEPLYNYRNVMKAFRILIDPEGMNLASRRVTVSTSGIVPVLKQMAQEPVLPNLAISLNSTTNATRSRVMPVNLKWDLDELLEACRQFPLEPRRRITMEYVLLKGETDSDDDARRLARLLDGIPVKVNLIPYNPNPGLPHARPEPRRVERFREILNEFNISNFTRKTRGQDVSAACGQLAWFEEAPVAGSRPPMTTGSPTLP